MPVSARTKTQPRSHPPQLSVGNSVLACPSPAQSGWFHSAASLIRPNPNMALGNLLVEVVMVGVLQCSQ